MPAPKWSEWNKEIDQKKGYDPPVVQHTPVPEPEHYSANETIQQYQATHLLDLANQIHDCPGNLAETNPCHVMITEYQMDRKICILCDFKLTGQMEYKFESAGIVFDYQQASDEERQVWFEANYDPIYHTFEKADALLIQMGFEAWKVFPNEYPGAKSFSFPIHNAPMPLLSSSLLPGAENDPIELQFTEISVPLHKVLGIPYKQVMVYRKKVSDYNYEYEGLISVDEAEVTHKPKKEPGPKQKLVSMGTVDNILKEVYGPALHEQLMKDQEIFKKWTQPPKSNHFQGQAADLVVYDEQIKGDMMYLLNKETMFTHDGKDWKKITFPNTAS